MDLDTPNRYRDMILDYEVVLHRIRRDVEQIKAIAFLEDGTNLRISEVFVSGALKKYSYYWLDIIAKVALKRLNSRIYRLFWIVF